MVLASASPRRKELLADLGLPFEVAPSSSDESLVAAVPTATAVQLLAEKKAAAVAARYPDTFVLGVDTMVDLDGEPMGKPEDAEAARSMLRRLSGRRHRVFSGLSLHRGQFVRTLVVATEVTMRRYTNDEIEQTIACGSPFDKAGSYAIQDEMFHPVQSLDGCYCNVMGLPMWTVWRLLRDLAFSAQLQRPDACRPVCAKCPLRALPEGGGC
ncbi:MAG: Maf family protein [Dehalococcoidia bacterium]